MKKKILSLTKTVLLGIILILYIIPFVMVLINSFKNRVEIVSNPVGLPKTYNFANYIDAYVKMNYSDAFINSLIITVISVILIVVISSMTAYILVREKWKFNKIIFFVFVASMIIPFRS